ncbi:hypothetical protein JR316_0005577 [Psilocybe cubensis]|nr:hypothetical protein JR316_0005577 [Psilocybe cubensis]KAH9481058.1 hypothetical protein JR316_0005577 [Psilocybe cubensis]
MAGQLSLEKTFLLAAWIEGILYGFLCCIFGATMYIYFSSMYSRIGSRRDRHTTGMIIISAIMFFIASFHLVMNGFRLLRGYADERLAPGGPVGYLGVLRKWDHILKDTLYATQENLGSAAAIYRCWVLWNFDWRIIALPTILLFTNIAAGYVVCGTYPSIDPTASIFNPVLLQWIKTFYSIAVVLNVMTTGLMSYRIWIAHKNSASYIVGKGRLISIIRILIESAALQLIVEVVLLALYTANLNAQYILLECVTPTVAITFNTITLRIKLQSEAMARSRSMGYTDPSNAVQTIGSLPMKRLRVNINRETDQDTSEASYDDKTNAV